MSILVWLNEHLTFSRKRMGYHESMDVSADLSEAKRVLARASRQLEDETDDAPVIVQLPRNILEDVYLNDRTGRRRDDR